MPMDFELILKNGFAWRKNTRVWLYIALLIGLGLGFLVMAGFLIEEAIEKGIAVFISSADPAKIMTALIGTIALILSAFFAIALIQGFIYALLVLKGMAFYKIKTISFGLIEYIKFLILYFLSFLAALTSYYNKKFFLFFIGLIAIWVFGFAALFVSSGLGMLLMAVGFIAWIPYFFIVIYNSFRLSMAPFVFLEQGDVFNSLKKSYEITAGKVLEIFIAIIIVSILIGILVFIADQIGQALVYAFFPELSGLQQMASSQPTQMDLLMSLEMINSLLENMAEIMIIGGILSTIVTAIMSAFSAYAYAGIYSQVKKK